MSSAKSRQESNRLLNISLTISSAHTACRNRGNKNRNGSMDGGYARTEYSRATGFALSWTGSWRIRTVAQTWTPGETTPSWLNTEASLCVIAGTILLVSGARRRGGLLPCCVLAAGAVLQNAAVPTAVS